MHDPQHPMIAREPDGSGSVGAARKSTTGGVELRLATDISPEAAIEKILALLGGGSYLVARQLAREAIRRFPEHAGVRRIAGVFEPRGKATVRPDGPRQPDRREEFDWLRDPPASARGKWVALVGAEVVAADESLAELERKLRSLELAKRPLVHRVD